MDSADEGPSGPSDTGDAEWRTLELLVPAGALIPGVAGRAR